MAVQNTNYEMKNYQTKSEFSSFLPGISGPHGIPMWCYYTNRGQAVSCFGVQDKDHSIMEFYPAHQAYERTPLMGFRTFLKINGVYMEAFSDPESDHTMQIGMNSLVLEEETEQYHIRVEYETLPMEPLAGLMRSVTVTNRGEDGAVFELADGMPEIIPYGVTATTMKEMGQTAKAWMQVLDRESGYPRFKVRASMEDSAEVTEIRGMNFAMAREVREGRVLPVVVDRGVLFRFDHSLRTAYGMKALNTEELLAQEQVECNDVPCCFFLGKKTLDAGESFCVQELYGMSEEEEAYEALKNKFSAAGWFEEKQNYAKQLAEEITDRIATKTGNRMFDGYCRQSYLDNLLRGGYPIRIGQKQVFYLYSRKHGDMERDYNFFSMLPEYYSQGNGNFRDVNQNRRCDVLFSPFVGDSAIRTFYNALQINGYNPLVIEKIIFRMKQKPEKIDLPVSLSEGIRKLLEKEFTPGILYRMLEKELQDPEKVKTCFEQIMDRAERIDRTTYGEGHWSDHWTYNLDLITSYLSVFPEKEQELLYGEESYVYTQAEKQILPRRKRYVPTEKGIRQYEFLKANADTSKEENRYLENRRGEIVKVSLMTKLFTLLTNKVSALDPYAMGIEMEGGKPGWYDALNGLPGLLGSSMAEASETLRMARYMRNLAEKNGLPVRIPEEVAVLQEALQEAMEEKLAHPAEGQETVFWNAINEVKERFWEETAKELSGASAVWEAEKQKAYLDLCIRTLERGAEKAKVIGGDVPPTYFYYEVTDWKKDREGILPVEFAVRNTPNFLEGAVHAMKLADDREKKAIYESVKNSALYDRKLGMYKVNASLSKATFELGRACAFTPGWLENESVWLHMEYKYLLELLKAGLVEEFTEDFHAAAIPFLDGEVYGRSLLENSSFIASSANGNRKIHGKGFVARLSGSTAEFLQIWQIMMFGQQPFTMEGGELDLEFAPCIPSYVVNGEKTIEAAFLGGTKVVYELEGLQELIPGRYRVKERFLSDEEGGYVKVDSFRGETAEKIRRGEVSAIKYVFEA